MILAFIPTLKDQQQLNIPSDVETSDAQREDGRMTSEDSYMIGTDLMVYHDDDDVVVDDKSNLIGLIIHD
jgi:hypothetical protein